MCLIAMLQNLVNLLIKSRNYSSGGTQYRMRRRLS